LKSHVTKIHTKSSSTAGEAQSTPSAASSSSKEWDCFVGQHGSRWTWSEDYPLIKLTHQYKGHWGKVLTEFHAKKIGGEKFVHNEDQLRRRYETVTKTWGTLWRDIVVPTFRVPTGTEDVENKKEEHLKKYWKAQKQQKKARKMHREFIDSKKPRVDSAVTTSKAIDNHIQTADKHRKIQRQENRTQWQQACLLEIKGRQTQIVHYHLMHLLLQRSAETEEALVEHLTGKRVIHPNEDEYRATLEHYTKLMKEAWGELANEVETQNDKGKEKADQEKELESNDPYSVPPPSTEENDIALCRSYWGLLPAAVRQEVWNQFSKGQHLQKTQEWFLQMVQNEQAMETTPGNEGREGEEEDEDDTPTIQDMETLN
jgi:hypothetical protein